MLCNTRHTHKAEPLNYVSPDKMKHCSSLAVVIISIIIVLHCGAPSDVRDSTWLSLTGYQPQGFFGV